MHDALAWCGIIVKVLAPGATSPLLMWQCCLVNMHRQLLQNLLECCMLEVKGIRSCLIQNINLTSCLDPIASRTFQDFQDNTVVYLEEQLNFYLVENQLLWGRVASISLFQSSVAHAKKSDDNHNATEGQAMAFTASIVIQRKTSYSL